MGNCGGGAAHRGSVSGTGARHGAGPVSLCHSRLSLRHGSKFINQTVARLLNKLMIEQTKSRPRHSNDNGLAETKNGAIIGKHMGWGHLQEVHADPIQQFYSAHLNPYLNYTAPVLKSMSRWTRRAEYVGAIAATKPRWRRC